MSLAAPFVDGELVTNTSQIAKKETKTSNSANSMDKEAFLQLLVTQMQYQDPLNPQADTEFISQLAQFSSLEQMQNLNESFSNTSALSLVGKTVTVTETDKAGNSTSVTGVVDFVNRDGSGKSYVSIDGTTYSADNVTKIYDDYYLMEQKLPQVESANLTYDHGEPKDLEINLTLGEDEYESSAVAVMVGDKTIDASYLKYNNGVLTIDKEAFKDFETGTYSTAFVFSNSVYSTVTDKVTIAVKGIAATEA